jgi:hypothetical protein
MVGGIPRQPAEKREREREGPCYFLGVDYEQTEKKFG